MGKAEREEEEFMIEKAEQAVTSPTRAKRPAVIDLTVIALVTAITCILAPLSIPIVISPVPVTLTNLVLYLSLYILKTRKALISYLIYLMLGLVGLPVFSGFSGGLGKLAGPTGGYLVGFIFMILVAGPLVERARGKIWLQIAGLILGTAVCYAFGTVWLAVQMKISIPAGLAMGVLPYLPGDGAKMILAALTGQEIAKRIKAAQM